MSRFPRCVLFVLLPLVLAAAAAFYYFTVVHPDDARPQVTSAWNNARAAGGYSFRSDIQQSDIPVASTTSIGRTSIEHSYHLEGSTNLSEKKLDLTVWDNGGNVTQKDSGSEIKIENGHAYGRHGDQPWQEIGDFTDGIAPQGDFMAFLAGANNIVAAGHETRDGISFTRYTFDLNGVGFAEYVRDQLQARMQSDGELPYGLQIGLAEQYKNLKGTGELWVRSDSLPIRQIINVEFPPRNDSFVRATITTDFFDFPNYAQFQNNKNFWVLAVENFPQARLDAFGAWVKDAAVYTAGVVGGALNGLVPPLQEELSSNWTAFLGVLLVSGLIYFFFRFHRSRYVYNALVIFVVLSMEMSPLMQTAQASTFSAAQQTKSNTQQQKQDQTNAEQRAVDATALGNASNPHTSPYVTGALNKGTPPTAPVTNPSAIVPTCTDTSDLDGDGLKKCEEDLLGTDPNSADTDGDGLSDGHEVQGFTFGGQTWYSDPLKPSTMDDSILDGQKCTDAQFPNCPDTDGDGTPDLFDRDIDGDGVSNSNDISPMRVNAQTFGATNPLSLVVNNLQQYKPTYVEFQIRPTDPKHLWYAFNVLDWVSGDKEGQVRGGE